MLYHEKPNKIYLFMGVVDFRKQINGLTQLISVELPGVAFQSSWFVFISRDRKQVKIIYWRGSGLCLWQYRLEKNKFESPRLRTNNHYGISSSNLRRFLDGFNIFEGEAHKKIIPKRYS